MDHPEAREARRETARRHEFKRLHDDLLEGRIVISPNVTLADELLNYDPFPLTQREEYRLSLVGGPRVMGILRMQEKAKNQGLKTEEEEEEDGPHADGNGPKDDEEPSCAGQAGTFTGKCRLCNRSYSANVELNWEPCRNALERLERLKQVHAKGCALDRDHFGECLVTPESYAAQDKGCSAEIPTEEQEEAVLDDGPSPSAVYGKSEAEKALEEAPGES